MDIVKLRAFYTVAKLGSISRAAKELNYTQPAISAQIRYLENMLDARLLEKEGRRIHLTEAGRIILPFVERLLRDYDMIIAAIPKSINPEKSHFRIGASSLPGVHLIPQILAEFNTKFPDVSFSLLIDKATRIERMIIDHYIDVGIIGRKKIHPPLPSFNEYLLKKDDLVAVVAAKHLFSSKECISLEELSQMPLILPQRDVLTRRSVEERFHQRGYAVHVAFEVSNTEAIKRMVSHNLGITILPSSSVQQEIEAGWLVALPVTNLNLYRYIYLISRKTADLDPNLQSFIDFAIQRCS
jgi:DNA-binding transcriptional LysR family regulator